MGAESSAALVAQLIGQRLADEVMTLIADTAASAERGDNQEALDEQEASASQTTRSQPTTRSHLLSQKRSQGSVLREPEKRHITPLGTTTTTTTTTPTPRAKQSTTSSRLLETKRLVDEVDEYEGSVEDQLAKDAMHYQASPGKPLANQLTGSMSRQQVNAAVAADAAAGFDSGKWHADTDTDSLSASISTMAGDESGQANLLPGRPGVDYPIHWQVPKTSFDCRNYEQSGFYADVESDCQAYHSCHKGRGGRHTFLCPNGTLFSQELLTCDWWYNVECSASKLYLTSESAVNSVLDSVRAASNNDAAGNKAGSAKRRA